MREERETPSAMTCVCYGLLPCDRAPYESIGKYRPGRLGRQIRHPAEVA